MLIKKKCSLFFLSTEAIIRNIFLSRVLLFFMTFLTEENFFFFDESPGYLYLTGWVLCKSTANEDKLTDNVVGRDSSFGIATRCGLYGTGIEFL